MSIDFESTENCTVTKVKPLHPLSANTEQWMEEHRQDVLEVFDGIAVQKPNRIGCVDPRTNHKNTIGIPGLGISEAIDSPHTIQRKFSWIPRAIEAGEQVILQTHDDCRAIREAAEKIGVSPEKLNNDWGEFLSEFYGVPHEHLSHPNMRKSDDTHAPVVYLDATGRFSPQDPFPPGFRVSILGAKHMSRHEAATLDSRDVDAHIGHAVRTVIRLIHGAQLPQETKNPVIITLAVVRDSARESLSDALQIYANGDIARHDARHYRVVAFDERGRVHAE